MKVTTHTALALALACAFALPACSKPTDSDAAAMADAAEDTGGVVAKAIHKEITKARKELHEGNLVISGDHNVDVAVGGWKFSSGGKPDADRPRAEITPAGDLLVDGGKVEVTPAQRKLLVRYREEVLQVADIGMEIGSKGAALASEAIGDAIGSIFSGDTEEMEKRVEAKAEALKQEARAICGHLPAMLETQQRLAASLPAFEPYARMTQEDVDDCMKDIDDKGVWSTQ